MQFSYDIELIGHTETYHSGFDKGYQASKLVYHLARASISQYWDYPWQMMISTNRREVK